MSFNCWTRLKGNAELKWRVSFQNIHPLLFTNYCAFHINWEVRVSIFPEGNFNWKSISGESHQLQPQNPRKLLCALTVMKAVVVGYIRFLEAVPYLCVIKSVLHTALPTFSCGHATTQILLCAHSV